MLRGARRPLRQALTICPGARRLNYMPRLRGFRGPDLGASRGRRAGAGAAEGRRAAVVGKIPGVDHMDFCGHRWLVDSAGGATTAWTTRPSSGTVAAGGGVLREMAKLSARARRARPARAALERIERDEPRKQHLVAPGASPRRAARRRDAEVRAALDAAHSSAAVWLPS